MDISDAPRHGLDRRWCAAYIDGKRPGNACPNGRPTPLGHPKDITPPMKAFASAHFEWEARRANDGRRGRGNDRQVWT